MLPVCLWPQVWLCVCQPLSLWESGFPWHWWVTVRGVHLIVLSNELVLVFHLSPLRYFLLLGSQTYRDSRWQALFLAHHWWWRTNAILTVRRVYPQSTALTPCRPFSIRHPAVDRPPLSHLRPQICCHLLRHPPLPQHRPSLRLPLDQAVSYPLTGCACSVSSL